MLLCCLHTSLEYTEYFTHRILFLLFAKTTFHFSSIMRAPSLFHLRAPGSGKGTISNWIVRDFALAHVSSGDLLRMHLKEKTPLGKKAQQFVDKGELVPDDLMVDLVTSELKKKESTPWLLDGFPRTRFQAEILHERTPVDVVINLDVPFETIIDRVKDRWVHPGSGRIYNTLFNPPKVPGKDDETGEDLMQREDDKPESVRRRLEIFSDSTRPVLDFLPLQRCLY
ncbi:AK3 [Lepeophtheirus salmonis]|uniref:AK3 n=1 Tax=Lepeophtheirus salmonis TaxID=72036 RepID=A0A7R8CB31_LEPSM|nr:AK3 [Lepeophtheirus salmonis]CAF2756783.1 AK3 [Lepeophtheirus salmonis]